ncbi:Morphology and auto-aggregation control protein [Hartmannibacter diazotrophicus]|uniref:Morphology and auto-aggregation control protein n=1 Tax=Hartmannibacter diazotrophicus TaxID=1482074 RepID=A0A2C9D5U6_9HYPH|nr:LysR substrate-binding domain-containing protein [Hartmannibacter diazotrophicus]SON55694.1 Morphology and auto-aggregation control protein [Hartmannibacter diazotrophicus]
MDTRFLESLLAVVETGSIAGAARRQNLTATAVSQRMRALEQELGCELLSRGAHSAAPTEACLALLPRAQALLREASLLHADVRRESLSGEMRIGAISTVLTSLVPHLLHESADKAPDLKLKLLPGSSSHLYEQLVSGQIDAAILVTPPFTLPKTLTSVPLRSEPLVFISDGAPTRRTVSARVAEEPFIRYDSSSWGGQLAQAYLRHLRLEPDVRFDLDALETISLLVSKGLGNALVPFWPGLEQTGVALTELPDAQAFARGIVLLHASLPARPRAMGLLRDIAVSAASEIGPSAFAAGG